MLIDYPHYQENITKCCQQEKGIGVILLSKEEIISERNRRIINSE